LCCLDNPFVLASQVHQVFYVQDPIESDRHYVMQVLPRDLFVVKEETDGETGAAYWGDYRDSRVQLVIFMSNNDIN